ncbi:hypothetical protein ACVWYH_000866 [Bradyrhizobium sp. GM24.11]
MRTLIYKRTHSGDPDPECGVFGNNDCMGRVRGWQYDAVIGIGGIGPEPMRYGIAGRLTWVGIGPHKVFDNPNNPNDPRVTFDHFWYRGERGPPLAEKYPALAKRMYEKNVRVLIHMAQPAEGIGQIELDRDIKKILALAKRASAFRPRRKGRRNVNGGMCHAKPC